DRWDTGMVSRVDGAGRRRTRAALVRRDWLGRRTRRGVELEDVAGGIELRSVRRAQESEVANLGEAARQHMLEEGRDEGSEREREATPFLRPCVGVGGG